VTGENVAHLALLAHEYSVPEVAKLCRAFLAEQPLTVDVVCLAERCGYDEIVRRGAEALGNDLATFDAANFDTDSAWLALEPETLVAVLRSAAASAQRADASAAAFRAKAQTGVLLEIPGHMHPTENGRRGPSLPRSSLPR
jgi:hypothetical protein